MIDWSRVRELREEIGEEDFEEISDVFLAEVEEVIDRLQSAPDPATYQHDFHFLKSSALNLGFSDFSSLCQEAELLSSAGKEDGVELAKIFSTYDRSKARFLAGPG